MKLPRLLTRWFKRYARLLLKEVMAMARPDKRNTSFGADLPGWRLETGSTEKRHKKTAGEYSCDK